MIRLFLTVMAVLALCAESIGQPPAPAPVAACPARATQAACESPLQLGEPYRLTPARISAEGKLVFRHQQKLANCIPCVVMKKAADGSTTEGVRAAVPFKPSAVVNHETMDPADVRWFGRDGKPVDAEAVRKQLAVWSPVLVSPDGKNVYSSGSCQDALMECFRPDLLIAVVPTEAQTPVGHEQKPANGPAPASPVPIRARMDEKGRVIFRPMLKFKPVYEHRVRTITFNTDKGKSTKEICYTVCQWVMELKCEELAVESKYVQFFDAEGNPVDAAAAAPQLGKETTVLVSGDGEKVNPFFLKAAQPGTLVCVLPFDVLATGDVNSPVKATVEPRRCESPKPCHATAPAPVRAPEVASPLPSPGAAVGLPNIDETKAKELQETSAKRLGLPVLQANSIGMRLALIPPGEFLMGSPDKVIEEEKQLHADVGFYVIYVQGESPQHRVRITKPFCLGIHEVTVGQFRKFVADTGYKTQAEQDGKGAWGYDGKSWAQKPEYSWQNTGILQSDDYPVFNMSWNDATAFCQWLSRKEGQIYRLPTEAEWEYACRAGTTTRYYFGDNDGPLENHAWFDKNCGETRMHPVGQKLPNPWGLFDVYGNVFELCADWYGNDYYAKSPVDDPRGPDSGYDPRGSRGPGHVHRGGGSSYSSFIARSAYRSLHRPDRLYPAHMGFRVAREIPPNVTAGLPNTASSPASEQTARLAEWESLKYGMLIQFNMATFTGAELGIAHESPNTYAPTNLDVKQWIRVAKEAGMKYAVLTAKHFSGFCLWPSDVDDYNVKSGGDKTDVVGEFMKACKEEGIKPGLYYAIVDDRNEGKHDWDSPVGDAYFKLIQRHITELHTRYPGIVNQWFPATGKLSLQQRQELYTLVKRLSPDCVVTVYGSFDPNRVQVSPDSFPADVYTIKPHQVTMPPRYNPVKEVGGKNYYLPMQVHDALSKSWFWMPGDPLKSVDDLTKLYNESVGRGANLVLNVTPDKTGRIPCEYVHRLQEFKQAIDVMESNHRP